MRDDGRIVINIGDGKNGSIPTHANIINFMIELGYGVLTTIIWNKKNTSSRTAWGS
jgi:DNA modification methylase